MPPTPRRQRFRRITPQDNATTVPQRVTFPTGTYISNPSGAADGPLGTGGAMLPARQQFTQLQANINQHQNAIQAGNVPRPQVPRVGGASGGASLSAAPLTPRPPSTYGPTANVYQGANANQPPAPNLYNMGRGISPQRVMLDHMESQQKLPTNLSNADLQFFNSQGLDVSQLAQYYTLNPSTGQYVLNEAGAGVNANTGAPGAAGNLRPGQYVDASGNTRQGTTPFGTNAAGQRLDASGNAWDPSTATADIYGGQFVQEGAVRWERNKNGRLVKVQIGKGGKKTVISGGKGQNKAMQQQQQYAGRQPQQNYSALARQKKEEVKAVANSFMVSFNVATG